MKTKCWLILLIMFHVGRLDAAAQSRRIIIDCDPGIDDAMAIILAMQYSGFDIVGITTVFGNAYLDQPTPKSGPLAQPAARFIADTAKASPGQITILAVGRLTNLAEAMKLDPNLTRNVKEVVLMGGAVFPGNVSPVAEANISGDPDAADLVLTAPWKVTMIALNTTTKVKLDDDILLRIKNNNSRYGSFVFAITRFYADFHKNVNHVEGGFFVHDPSAVMYLIDPSIFTVRQGPVRVVREGIAIGQTIMPAYDYQLEMAPWRGRPLVTTASDVDVKRFVETFESVMTRGTR